jgi:hypothetical protein
VRVFVIAMAFSVWGCEQQPQHVDRCQGFGVEVDPTAGADGGALDLGALGASIEQNVDGAACQVLLSDRLRCAPAGTLDACGTTGADAQALDQQIRAFLLSSWPWLVGVGSPTVDTCFCESF